jgi:hypothetical protein
VTALVVIEAVVLALLTILVIALLRSHADILKSLHDMGAGVHQPVADDDDAVPFTTREGVPSPRSAATADARISDFSGRAVDDSVISIGVESTEHDTLLAFLSSTCLTCRDFWDAFADPAQRQLAGENTRVVIVTKSADEESPAMIEGLASNDVTVVMSSEAWLRYEVQVAPYFLFVEGASGVVLGEGAASSWAQVRSLLSQAEDDGAHGLRRRSGAVRAQDSDEALRRAGIEPSDPSLYPSRQASGEDL